MKFLERVFNRLLAILEENEHIAEQTYHLLEQHGFFVYRNYHK